MAWVLVRYPFPGRNVVDALVDLPFAMPTAVSGIALTAIYAPDGWIGRWLDPLGIKVAYTPLGVMVALTFIGLPFVVRTLQPALEDMDMEIEEAAASLGATRLANFRARDLPDHRAGAVDRLCAGLRPALGEYGSVVFISGNLPMKTQITPLLIITKLEQYNYAEAAAIAVVTLAASFAGVVVHQFIAVVEQAVRRLIRIRTNRGLSRFSRRSHEYGTVPSAIEDLQSCRQQWPKNARAALGKSPRPPPPSRAGSAGC